MSHVGLISCVSKKRASAARAKDLYDSALFTKSRGFVEQRCDSWFILSVKYGLVEPNEVLEPYEEALNTKSCVERDEWAERVWASLRQRLRPDDHVTILAGERYRERLRKHSQRRGETSGPGNQRVAGLAEVRATEEDMSGGKRGEAGPSGST